MTDTPTHVLNRLALAAELRRIDSDPGFRRLFVTELDAAIAQRVGELEGLKEAEEAVQLEAVADALAVALAAALNVAAAGG